jgi:hypothetical protein
MYGAREASLMEKIFGPMPEASAAKVHREALMKGYEMGFEAARDKIATMLEEEGKAQTALRVRKLKLCKKSR